MQRTIKMRQQVRQKIIRKKGKTRAKFRSTLQNLVPKDVMRKTGFHDLFCLLSYAVIICGGDINLITSSFSKMTWLEEWIFYFEFIYGHQKIAGVITKVNTNSM